ncbi:MAG: hypothetical protein R6W90_04830 [Ignavibacteriaceae bacterium]
MKIDNLKKVRRVYTQKIFSSPEKVFPLLCPVREADWVDGWDPEVVFTNSGVAEQGCIFITSADGINSTWYINRYEPENYFVEMIKFTPGLLITKLEIQLKGNANYTDAEIAYTFYAVSEKGERELDKFTPDYYKNFMKEWEDQMNFYLTSKMKEHV